MFLENSILKLRAPEPEDLDKLYCWENMTDFWVSSNARQPYSKFALKKYISEIPHDIFTTGNLRMMITEKLTGEVAGTVDLFDFEIHHSRIALGLFIAPEFQGEGYAWQSLEIVETYVFEYLKINQLYCEVAKNNPASLHLFRKQDYHENTLLQWINTPDGNVDIAVFQRFREEYRLKKSADIHFH